jgi:hypothetical protein
MKELKRLGYEKGIDTPRGPSPYGGRHWVQCLETDHGQQRERTSEEENSTGQPINVGPGDDAWRSEGNPLKRCNNDDGHSYPKPFPGAIHGRLLEHGTKLNSSLPVGQHLPSGESEE